MLLKLTKSYQNSEKENLQFSHVENETNKKVSMNVVHLGVVLEYGMTSKCTYLWTL